MKRPASTASEEAAAKTIAHYERSAESFWEATRDHDVSENYAALLRAIEGRPPFRILDFGCGPGRDLVHFRSLGHEAVGLDGSSRFVAMAHARSGCEVLHQDFLHLDLPAARFDGVFANASLFHVPTKELPRVLGELADALAPRGVLFASNPRGEDSEGPNGDRWGAFHSLASWRAYVTAAGFDEVEHYYRPAGKPRAEQPWLATVWRKSDSRAAYRSGVRLFDAGAFWDAHEAWERRWRIEPDEAERRTLQALIQIAAGFHKLLVVRDRESAARLLAKGLAKLDAPELASFRAGVAACADAIAAGRFDAAEIPKLDPRLLRAP